MISKVFCKILVSFRLLKNLEISDLAMAKDEKVNTAGTSLFANYSQKISLIQFQEIAIF
jgi:hypothetical protein